MNPTRFTFVAALISLLAASGGSLFGQGTVISYQGRLDDGNGPANGSYDLRFALFAASSGGGAVAGPVTNTAVGVSNGLFTVALDFGAGAFSGVERWLEIGARTNGGGIFTTLAPRQPITSAPYAIFAGGASNLLGTVGSSQLSGVYTNPLTFSSSANSFSGNGAGLTGLNASQLTSGTVPDARISPSIARDNEVLPNLLLIDGSGSGLDADLFDGLNSTAFARAGAHPHSGEDIVSGTVADARIAATIARDSEVVPLVLAGAALWQLGGNFGTTTGTHFLGTRDNQALEFRVNGSRAFRLEPHATSPNAIGGFSNNIVGVGYFGSTISGGGGLNTSNAIYGDYATVAGGRFNSVGANSDFSAIAGGHGNLINAASSFSTIAGGSGNSIAATSRSFPSTSGNNYCTIAGGGGNTIGTNSAYSAIGGGRLNSIGTNSQSSTIAGGQSNAVGTNSFGSIIAGGVGNEIGVNVTYGTIGGGEGNLIQPGADNATIPGGADNIAGGAYSFAAGHRASATLPGTFVWADSQNATFGSGLPDSVSFRCQGGVRFTSGTGETVAWLPGLTSWSFSSDRNLKEGLTAVDSREVLDKVAQLPMNEWNFKGHPQRHIGPMAQDFHALFPLNDNDRMIDSGDLHGVALAAIKGLNQKVESESAKLREELKRRDVENAELKTRLEKLERILNRENGGAK